MTDATTTERLTEVLAEHPAGLATLRVAQALGVDRSQARQQLDRARVQGLVVVEGRGRGMRWKLAEHASGGSRHVPAVQHAEPVAGTGEGAAVKVTLSWMLSDRYIEEQIIATGRRPAAAGKTTFDLSELADANLRKRVLGAARWQRLIPVLHEQATGPLSDRLCDVPVSDDPFDQRRTHVTVPSQPTPVLDLPPAEPAEALRAWERLASEWDPVWRALFDDVLGCVVRYQVGSDGPVQEMTLRYRHPLRERADAALMKLRDGRFDAKPIVFASRPGSILEVVEAMELIATRLERAWDVSAAQLPAGAGGAAAQ